MKFKHNFLANYLTQTPIPLALERGFECEILATQNFQRPILDVGCGEGLFAYLLFDEKIDTGIDPNQRELDRCKDFQMYDELLCCFGDKVPKPDQYFATIFSNSVMEHIPAIEPVLLEMHRLLKTEGNVFLTLPTNLFNQNTIIYTILNGLGLKGLAKKFTKFYNNFWRHYHDYDVAGWKSLFAKTGFEVVQCREYNPRRTCMINDALVPYSLLPLICKKLFNRWYILPPLRKIVAKLWATIFEPVLKNNLHKQDRCGLVFFELRKRNG